MKREIYTLIVEGDGVMVVRGRPWISV